MLRQQTDKQTILVQENYEKGPTSVSLQLIGQLRNMMQLIAKLTREVKTGNPDTEIIVTIRCFCHFQFPKLQALHDHPSFPDQVIKMQSLQVVDIYDLQKTCIRQLSR